MEFEPLFDSLEKHERVDLKFLIMLFPCYYFLYYLYYVPFLDLTAFTQCLITAATTIIAYTFFRLVVFALAILVNFAGIARMGTSVFRYNALFVALAIVWGFFGGYTLCTLYKVCGAVFALVFVQLIYLFCRFRKNSVVRGIKDSPDEQNP
jgi:drug/metabolite transporter superfamily protein YnfA